LTWSIETGDQPVQVLEGFGLGFRIGQAGEQVFTQDRHHLLKPFDPTEQLRALGQHCAERCILSRFQALFEICQIRLEPLGMIGIFCAGHQGSADLTSQDRRCGRENEPLLFQQGRQPLPLFLGLLAEQGQLAGQLRCPSPESLGEISGQEVETQLVPFGLTAAEVGVGALEVDDDLVRFLSFRGQQPAQSVEPADLLVEFRAARRLRVLAAEFLQTALGPLEQLAPTLQFTASLEVIPPEFSGTAGRPPQGLITEQEIRFRFLKGQALHVVVRAMLEIS